jgi:uncharacterized cupin superfamily protein
MAQAGYTPIQLFYSNTATNVPAALANGELAINQADGKLYYRNNAGTVTLFAPTITAVSTISFGSTGLTPNTATSGAVTVAGTLVSGNGGTGFSTYAAGDLVYASAINTLAKLTAGTNGHVLTLAAGLPTWAASTGGVTSFSAGTTGLTPNTATTGAIVLAGTLELASGGTGLSSFTAGDLVYFATGTSFTKLAIGTAGHGGGTAPQWATGAASGVSSFSGGTTGLTPSTATTGVITLAGTLIAVNGGTGISSYAQGEMLYANTTTTLDKVTANITTSKKFLSQTGTGTAGLAPTWGDVAATDLTGTLLLANGGTGLSSFTAGDIVYFASGTSFTKLGIGTAGQVLTVNGGGTAPTWATAASGGVTSISFGTTGLTPSTATTGAVTVAGTLAVANGGTGVTASTGTGSVVLNTTPALTNPTVTNYTEQVFSATGSSFTIDLANGTYQALTLNANASIVLPSSVSGKSYLLRLTYTGSFSVTFSGGSTLKFPGGTTPTTTSANGKFDIFAFFCDGTNTYGQSVGLNY